MRTLAAHLVVLSATLLAGCQGAQHPPLALAARVDLARFMGDWYVIAGIPTFPERGAHNALESYRLAGDGSIETTFSFRAGGFDGEAKRYTARGFVLDRESNAVWGMQLIWPLQADYRIAWLDPDYALVVIGREKRDHAWIMARTPHISEASYRSVLEFLARQGYDVSRVRKVPQRWT